MMRNENIILFSHLPLEIWRADLPFFVFTAFQFFLSLHEKQLDAKWESQLQYKSFSTREIRKQKVFHSFKSA